MTAGRYRFHLKRNVRHHNQEARIGINKPSAVVYCSVVEIVVLLVVDCVVNPPFGVEVNVEVGLYVVAVVVISVQETPSSESVNPFSQLQDDRAGPL